MRCPICQHDNPPQAKFCLECGSGFSVACSACNTLLPERAKFCLECGQPVAPASASGATPLGEARRELATAEGERRQLTVMFCDLIDSTQLSQRLDPEELREVIRAYQTVAGEAVRGYEGTIAQYLGDGVLVYFGYPRAHEDDPERAVRAGLAILADMEELNGRLEGDLGVRLGLRIGIHTGPAVVADIGGAGRHERAAVGETPYLASHLSDLAPPDSVLVSSTTHRLVHGMFACESLGELHVKGVSHPVVGHRVLRESGVGGRLAAAAVSGLSPFVGRERDLALIVDRWERARQGAGQVVLVSGEAGIGKSRLIARFREQLAGEPHVWFECRCSPYQRNSALYPVIDLLEQVIGLSANDSSRERLRKLDVALRPYAADVANGVPLLASLLSIPFEKHHTLPAMTPQRQKQLTVEALLGLLLAVAEERQVVFLIEDLHWVDPSTLELLGLLINQAATSSALVLMSCRTDFVPPWPEPGHMTHLALSRLTGAEVERLVAGVDAGRELSSEILQQVVVKTDGIPLFVEELTKMVLEGDLLERAAHGALAGAVPETAIPSTLQDLLMARLDRLASEKQVAHLAACIGRSFSYELLREVAPLDDEELGTALERLSAAELIYARGLPPRATYLFKHALIQEAAHQSLLSSTRRQYHRRIAEAMEKRLPEAGQANPELLAQHFTEAGCSREAIGYWLQAGQRAITRSANEEAIAHLSRAIGLVAGLDDPADRVRQELVLQTLLGIPLVVSRGYAAPEVERAFGRAHELTQQLEDAPALFEVVNGLRRFYLIRGNFERASELGARLAQLAEQRQDSRVTLYMEAAQGADAMFRGRLLDARAHCERAIALYDAHPERSDLLTSSEEVGATARAYASWTYWLLGYPDRALQARDEALAIARETSHPNTVAFAYAFAAALHRLRGEPEETRECAETAIDVGTEQGLPFWVAMATMFRGWALTQRGQPEDGIAEIRRGLDAWRATGAQLGRPYVSAMLAEACQAQGELAEARILIDETLVIAAKSGERYYEPELCRLRGELRRAEDGPYDEIDRCFQRAIALARDSHARSLELRAVVSRSRLLRDRGERQEALSTLVPMLDGFTEGLDTRDLKQAKALLTELS